MMGTRAKLIDGDEFDALPLRAKRRRLRFRPGERQRIKRKFWKRQRSAEKRALVAPVCL
jgi:hypothetical protein